jgi:hypothetical protein
MSLEDKISVKHEVVNFNGIPTVRTVARLDIHVQNLESLRVIFKAKDDVEILKLISEKCRKELVHLIEQERLGDHR